MILSELETEIVGQYVRLRNEERQRQVRAEEAAKQAAIPRDSTGQPIEARRTRSQVVNDD
jgi:hypothetical protein